MIFFQEPLSIGELWSLTGGEIFGSPEKPVSELATFSEARPGSLVVVLGGKQIKGLPPGTILVAKKESFSAGMEGISVEDPKKALVILLEHIKEQLPANKGIHDSSVISPGAVVDPRASIGPFCVIEEGARIARGAILKAHVFVGKGSVVDEDTVVHPHVVIYHGTRIGKNSIIHSGCVIGADGFGFMPEQDNVPIKIPQLGGVRIGNNVEIGACSTVDRGTISDTVIMDNVKMDDHVHVAHNVIVGKGCILVAMTGLAGSSVLEDGVIMAAKSGTGDHVRIGKGAQVAALGGAIKDVPPGAVVSGFPARDHRKNFRIAALTQRLPDLFNKVRELEKKISSIMEDRKC